MAKFLTPLIVKKVGARLWELYEPLVFESEIYQGQFIAPKGMRTNFASIPRFLWVEFPPIDIYDPAAVIHDGGYHGDLMTPTGWHINAIKSVADNLFHECLITCGVPEHQADLMYTAVVLFGNPKNLKQ